MKTWMLVFAIAIGLTATLVVAVGWTARPPDQSVDHPEFANMQQSGNDAGRYCAVIFGGAMSGLGGAFLSLSYSPMWAEGMTAGRGWIALALVVFASWRPWRLLFGAYLFGGVTILQLYAQGAGIGIPAQVMNMLPYLATILVLTAIAAGPWKGRLDAPACLGIPFRPST